jgi:hypothetical protein
MAMKPYWTLYHVYGANNTLLYIGTVTHHGIVCPTKNASYPCNEPWWGSEAERVEFGDGRKFSAQEFKQLQQATLTKRCNMEKSDTTGRPPPMKYRLARAKLEAIAAVANSAEMELRDLLERSKADGSDDDPVYRELWAFHSGVLGLSNKIESILQGHRSYIS